MLAQVFTKMLKDYIKILWIIVIFAAPNKYSYGALHDLQALILYCILSKMQEFLYKLSGRFGITVIVFAYYSTSCLVILVQEGSLIEKHDTMTDILNIFSLNTRGLGDQKNCVQFSFG